MCSARSANTGDAGACFHVRSGKSVDGGRTYRVDAGKSRFDRWSATPDGRYDLSVYGPHAFLRAFRARCRPPRKWKSIVTTTAMTVM